MVNTYFIQNKSLKPQLSPDGFTVATYNLSAACQQCQASLNQNSLQHLCSVLLAHLLLQVLYSNTKNRGSCTFIVTQQSSLHKAFFSNTAVISVSQ
jgi:hypothetical protein